MSSTTTLRSLSVWSICCSHRMSWPSCAQLLGSAEVDGDSNRKTAMVSTASHRLLMGHLRFSRLQGLGQCSDTVSSFTRSSDRESLLKSEKAVRLLSELRIRHLGRPQSQTAFRKGKVKIVSH